MDIRVKQRLVGILVLGALLVIFLPMLIDERAPTPVTRVAQPLPPMPPPLEDGFQSSILPLATDRIDAPAAIAVDAVLPVDPATAEVSRAEVAQSMPPAEKPALTEAPAPVAETPKPVPAAPKPAAGALSAWAVQVGSFSERARAEALKKRLTDAGFVTLLEPAFVGSQTFYRVRVGPELEREAAEKLQKAIRAKLRLKGQVLRYP
ncbi:MAG: SPOR domain-containing protein [Chromatiales bacterium]|nr:SPOR domain-containing protein [Chromatiales bacterium]